MEDLMEGLREAVTDARMEAKGWDRYARNNQTSANGTEAVDGCCPDCGDEVGYQRTAGGVLTFSCHCELEAMRQAEKEWREEHGPQLAAMDWQKITSVPGRYRGCRLDNFNRRQGTERALTLCRKWADAYDAKGTTRGLLLIGPFGSGKTHLAVATAYRTVERCGGWPHFVSAATLAHQVKQGEKLDMRPVTGAIRPNLLILDDIGQTGRTEFDRELIYRIVSERYEGQKPTICTSNLTESKLAESLGGALVSRLYEMTEMAVLTASDYRKTNRGR